ncbi:MAG: CYTH and CHAD domain-containing protein [Rhodocyclaceae bacterium]|nr:CYTH and CHAD domain-containing protein [Rhodocyclaceae bacterium]MDP1957065.1 CYTH and CHAD domain-containing protein [Rhodocyclaceae bacterium]
MAIQIALKLGLPEAAQAQFMRHPLLRRAASRHGESLVSIYYDTHRLTLHRQAITLRLRKHGAGWLQTVKHNADAESEPITRPEWEVPYPNRFDFSAIDSAAVRRVLEKPRMAQGLAALFETRFRRTTWQLEPAHGTTLLVILDCGWIAARGRRAPISDVEIKLVSGSKAQLYATAFALAARSPLTPELMSKAERGYRLISDSRPAPCRATTAPIAAADHPLTAFRAIALNCLAHLHHNHAGALRGDDPEYVHQMRVATRRLFAAMRMFAPVLPADFAEQMAPPLRELMAALGRTRDLDVLLDEIVGPVNAALADDPRIAALAGILADRRHATRNETVAFLARPGYGHLLLLAASLLHGRALAEPAPPAAGEPVLTLFDFAQRRLQKLQQRTHHLALLARIDDPSSLHALRIAIKRLRYALEFFGPLLPKRSFATAAKRLATLQDELGQLNDLTNAGTMLMACAGADPKLREAVALIGGWHGPRHAALLGAVPGQLKAVAALRLPKLK